MSEDTDRLIQQGLDAGLGAEEVKLWKHGAGERAQAEGFLLEKLFNLTARMESFERGLAANTEATNRIETNTAAMVEAFKSWQGAMRVLDWIGKAARPISYIAAAVAAVAGVILAFKSGGKP